MSDTELQSKFRELISLCNGASGVVSVIMDEMSKEFRNNPNETLMAAEREYKKRVKQTMDDLGRPESPISLFYSPLNYRNSADEALVNQLKDMKELDPEWYANVVKKVGLTMDSSVSEVAKAVSAAAKEAENANSK
jgi:hypothetical protein